jgi:hypothetical protein
MAFLSALLRRATALPAAVLVAAAVLGAQPGGAAELKMASGYPDGNYLTVTVRVFIADAQKRSGGAL